MIGGRMKGNMQGMMKQIQKMQAEMEKVQNELGNKTVTEESGGGMVKATANGKKEIVSVEIDKEIVDSGDKEMLEDLVVAAVNKALESAGKMAEEEMGNVTKGMIPPGMNIPGF
ncbi:MAG: YbaB/EbfC family nucleoid-associated protein [Melioribacteraceae bacterium]|nr:YbaB/EbfC family nucleoid-associated protein [Melioribacteraceae bacterium]MCF8355441.1 YbaB/EbfC family nucleoid-associated protein [Melioribacteraceae bacterium]MCF8395376.1 YbaB/EbfC family nucleoid-associated protein [Melioribacteraceae bacterium]MCF8420469.1 YbaB/EbfC family nucleoid-associated protein [Melioribacteraceae bacterium]